MPQAVNLLRDALHYRKDAFNQGLLACGYSIAHHTYRTPGPGDVLVIWNRYGGYHDTASAWEKHGARVLVVENGYLSKVWRGGNWFSLCLGHASGGGAWPIGGAERWESFGVPFAPWKKEGKETLILGQRSIGEPDVRSPPHWAEATQRIIGGRIRPHPGLGTERKTLEEDLRNVKQVVTWNSAAAVIALLHGYPVWNAWPSWLMASAAKPLSLLGKEEPLYSDEARAEAFHRMAWTLWNLEEIRTGKALGWLLGRECQ